LPFSFTTEYVLYSSIGKMFVIVFSDPLQDQEVKLM
jgi:hypothetical protein